MFEPTFKICSNYLKSHRLPDKTVGAFLKTAAVPSLLIGFLLIVSREKLPCYCCRESPVSVRGQKGKNLILLLCSVEKQLEIMQFS